MLILSLLFLGLAYWLYSYFRRSDRGAKEPTSALRTASFYGIAATFVVPFLYAIYLPGDITAYLEGIGPPPDTASLLTGSFIIGFTEELAKFLPLAFWIFGKKFFNETTDGIIYFGLAGMWFGVIENITYTFNYGQDVGLLRLFVTPFLHAGFSAIAGWGLAKYKLDKNTAGLVVGLLALSIGLHTLYDYLLFSGIPLFALLGGGIGIAVNLCVFYLFKRARREDEVLGLSTTGINTFCRNCGAPNRDSYIYCPRCGKKT